MYDLIGDIHGFATVLEQLLQKMDYEKKNGTYRHPERKVLFVGDYIDRGPQNEQVLRIIRDMVDAGQAIALMGNHEFNAIMFNEPDGNGEYLRPHTDKNINQHRAMLEEFEGRREEYLSHVEWFKTLPLFFENNHLRAIHACWDHRMIDEIHTKYTNGDAVLDEEHLREAGREGTRLYDLIENLLKGKEITLPGGQTFLDKDGNPRREARIKWWVNPKKASLEQWCMNEVTGVHGDPPEDVDSFHYPKNEKPVFFGHYWLSADSPSLQRSNICCLDYSIGHREKLVAYRYGGEEKLSEEHLKYVEFNG